MKLDIGSGPRPATGYVTVDIHGTPDVLVNLEWGSLFRDEVRRHMLETGAASITEIRASHVLEHVRNLFTLMDACWELLAPGGIMEIYVPHKDSDTAWQDPTHVRYFTAETFFYFTEFKHFGYVRHYWEFAQKPRGVDAYNQPAKDGEKWAGIHVVLRKQTETEAGS